RPKSCLEFVDDLTSTKPLPTPTVVAAAGNDWWYVQYTDADERARLVKGKVSGIRRSLKEGRLGDAGRVLICRTKNRAYGQLHSHVEFRDLVDGGSEEAARPARNETFTPTPAEAGFGTHENITLPKGAAARRPHIPLVASGTPALDWLKLALLVAFAVGLGILTALLVPK